MQPLTFIFFGAGVFALVILAWRREIRFRRQKRAAEKRQALLLMSAVARMRGFPDRYAALVTKERQQSGGGLFQRISAAMAVSETA